jgi:hypothetical protein
MSAPQDVPADSQRRTQRVSDERSNCRSCRNTTSPQNSENTGSSTHLSHSVSSERLCMCLRMNRPATNRVGKRWPPQPEATNRTEGSRQEVPIDLRRQTHQRMAKVDDLLQRWTKQIVLTTVARLANGFSPTANRAIKGITQPPNPESKNARKPSPASRYRFWLSARPAAILPRHCVGSRRRELFGTIFAGNLFLVSFSDVAVSRDWISP